MSTDTTQNTTPPVKRAYSPAELLRINRPGMAFTGEWREAFGCPPTTGLWCIWGNSGNGKSSFTVQLAKYLCRFGKVFYNSIEEGTGKSFISLIERYKMDEVNGKFFVNSLNIRELDERMSDARKEKIYIIDSLQAGEYTTAGADGFRTLCKKHPDRLIIFVSRAEGSKPQGRSAVTCMYDADVKIWIEGFRALCKGRFQEKEHKGKCFTIWDEGAVRYWEGKNNQTTIL